IGKSYLARSFSPACGHFKAPAARLSRNIATDLTPISQIARNFCGAVGAMGEVPVDANKTGVVRRAARHCQRLSYAAHDGGLACHSSSESGDLRRAKAVIRRMSEEMRQTARLNVKPSVVVWSRA
ncbi:MAG: hypothetical protein ACREDJ_11220, partial [Methylocella sp.]